MEKDKAGPEAVVGAGMVAGTSEVLEADTVEAGLEAVVGAGVIAVVVANLGADAVDEGPEDGAVAPPAIDSKGIFTVSHAVFRVVWSSTTSV
jgi:hypothetical protein